MADDYFKSPGHHVYDGIIYTVGFEVPVFDRIRKDFQLRHDDVLISSYPKAGTSWMLGIASLIYNANDLEATNKLHIDERVPFLEFCERGGTPLLDDIEKQPSPRLLKTHLPARFFTNHANMVAKKTKTIYVMRNPKDTLVSYYHFYRMNEYFGCYQGTWSEFFQLFKDDHLGLGNWFDIVLEWWAYRDTYDILFVKYEDLQKDPYGEIRRVAAYLEKSLTDEQLDKIVEMTSFASMRKGYETGDTEGLHHDISHFMRKGKVGDWRNYFSDEQSAYVDGLVERRLKDTGLTFDFVL